VLLARSELWPALEKTALLCSTATIRRRPEPNADIAGWGVRSIAHKGRNAHEADSKIYLGDRKSSGDCLPGRLARGVLYLLLCATNLRTSNSLFWYFEHVTLLTLAQLAHHLLTLITTFGGLRRGLPNYFNSNRGGLQLVTYKDGQNVFHF